MKLWNIYSLPAHSFNNLHMKSIDISVLIQYINNQLSITEKSKIDIFLRENPHYQKILRGLYVMQNDLRNGESLEDHLETKKQQLKKEIFKE